MSDPAFIEYINYLQYWREQPYRKFLVYPQVPCPSAHSLLPLLNKGLRAFLPFSPADLMAGGH